MKRFLAFSYFLCSSLLLPGQSIDTTGVLFLGNSYTYFWNLPQVVQAMAATQDVAMITRQSTIGGSNLGQHYHEKRGLSSRKKITEEDWDFVVLQDHSIRALEVPDSMAYYVGLLSDDIKAQGAQPLLYMTWARSYDPLMTEPIAEQYEFVGIKNNSTVVPIGRIWAKARSLRPDLALYDPDGSHPSPIGTYLTACAFYEVISGKSSIGLPSRLRSADEFGEPLYLLIIPPGDAQFCQRLVHEFLEHYEFQAVKTSEK